MGMLLKNVTGRLSTKADKGNAYLSTTVQGRAPLQGEEWDAVLPGKLKSYESAMPEVDDSLTALLKGLACSTVDVVGEEVRAIRLGNNATFLIDNALAGDTIYERSFYPQLVSAIRGLDRRVILISSVVGLFGSAGQVNYSSSKAALVGFARSLTRELGGRGITANVVAPGFITTDMTKALTPEQAEAYLKSIPAGRFADPTEVAGVVLWLASDDAGYISGAVIPVDGGLGMGH